MSNDEHPVPEENRNAIQTSGGELVAGNVNTAGGDFVGRDTMVFAGRDVVPAVTIVGQGNVIGDITIYPSTTVGRIGAQIERLRGRVTRLIPTEEALLSLSKLREPSTIGSRVGGEIKMRMPLPIWGEITSRLYTHPVEATTNEKTISGEEYLSALALVEAQISPEMEQAQLSQLLQRLSEITDDINVRIAHLNNLFVSLVYPATSSVQVFLNMVNKIGHRELREEAKMHLDLITHLVEKLDAEQLTRKDLDVLSDEAQSAVGVMTEIEKHRLIVEKLMQVDRRRRTWTVTVVISYIAVIIAITVFLVVRWGTLVVVGQAPLNQLRLPLLGVPWPVILWSLIVSFAAMIHRFNRRPIYDFGDAVKWMLTRPVQGVVLGAAFYLVAASGLFLLTGGGTSNPTSVDTADKVILVMSFLVGFSDRFADGVFNALVERYSGVTKDERTDALGQ